MRVGYLLYRGPLVVLRCVPLILTDHMSHCVETGQAETCLQESEKPADASWPTGVCVHSGSALLIRARKSMTRYFCKTKRTRPTFLRSVEQVGKVHRQLRTIDEIGEDKFATRIIGRCTCEYRDRDDDETGNRPGESPLRHIRKQRIAKSVEQESDEVVADIYQELVPSLRLVVLAHEGDDSDNELTA